jgi:hypothetical protein
MALVVAVGMMVPNTYPPSILRSWWLWVWRPWTRPMTWERTVATIDQG